VFHERLYALGRVFALMMRFDEERALATLPELLPSEAERREALEIVREVGRARGEISAEGEAVLARIERILGLEPKAVAEPAPPAKKRSANAAGA
jgi:hypothetical protein